MPVKISVRITGERLVVVCDAISQCHLLGASRSTVFSSPNAAGAEETVFDLFECASCMCQVM